MKIITAIGKCTLAVRAGITAAAIVLPALNPECARAERAENGRANNYELSLRGYLQLDGRAFPNDGGGAGRDDLLARRLRPILEAKAGDASFRFMPDIAGPAARIFDAHADYAFSDALKLRFGKFKPPIGLERLQSSADLAFIERGHPSNLAPTRDIGAMAYGEPVPDMVEYQLGLFNGNRDLGNSDDYNDDDGRKDIAARVFVHPLHNSGRAELQGLGAGVAGSAGGREGSASRAILGAYKSPGQQDFFRYRSGAFADGLHWRLFPQAYWHWENMGLLAEYAFSGQEVARGAAHGSLRHEAWQIAGSYVLTGEDVNFRGGVKPFADFGIGGGGIGAWELAARAGRTDVDDGAFPDFADPAVAASAAQSYGGGINWYWSENLKLMVNYDFTQFEGGAGGGRDRPGEHALFGRAQFRF